MLAALVTLASEVEDVKPLAASSLALYVGIIAAVCFAVVLAGLGYFTPRKDD